MTAEVRGGMWYKVTEVEFLPASTSEEQGNATSMTFAGIVDGEEVIQTSRGTLNVKPFALSNGSNKGHHEEKGGYSG